MQAVFGKMLIVITHNSPGSGEFRTEVGFAGSLGLNPKGIVPGARPTFGSPGLSRTAGSYPGWIWRRPNSEGIANRSFAFTRLLD